MPIQDCDAMTSVPDTSQPLPAPTADRPGLRPTGGVGCPGCGDELVEIELQIDGEPLVMLSCSACDRRSWHRRGESVALGGVLADISAVPTRYRRDLSSR